MATLAATVSACVLLVVGAVLSFIAVQGIEAGDSLVKQVQSIQFSAETLLSTLKDAETGQRGYLLTGDPDYREPYDAARARLAGDIARLRAMPLSTPERSAAIGRIEALIAGKIDELGRTMALRVSGNPQAALAVVRTNSGKQLMDAIRAEVRNLEAGADARLAQPRPRPRGIMAGAFGSAMLACGLMGWVGMVHRRARSLVATDQAHLRQFTRAFGMAHGMICELDGRISFWSEGSEQLYGFCASEAFGKNSHDLLSTVFDTSPAEIEAELRRSGRWSGNLEHRHKDGRALHVSCIWVLHSGEAGEPDSIIVINSDTTSLKHAEEARERDRMLLRTIVETAPGLIYAKDRQGRLLLANQFVLDLIGKPWSEIEGLTDADFLDDPAQAQAIMATDFRLMETDIAQTTDEVVGNGRVWLSNKAPLHDGAGVVTGLVGVSVEITGRRRAEDSLRHMVNELNHRAKNILATVQAIALQTLKGIDPAVRNNLVARLMALASVHDMLTRSNWAGADLDDIVGYVKQAHGGAARFHVVGPPLRLNPGAAQALALGLHELATNALLHGSLRAPGGLVHLRWDVVGMGDARLLMSWTERGGPPIEPPSTRGFGRRLIERGLAQELGGTVKLAFDPEGVSCLIVAPLTSVEAPAVAVPFPILGSTYRQEEVTP